MHSIVISAVKLASILFLVLAGASASAAQFSDFPAEPHLVEPATDLTLPIDNVRLEETAKDLAWAYLNDEVEPLAGKFLFGAVGCGTECSTLFGINIATGEVKIYDVSAFDFVFRADSNLLIVNRGGIELSFEYPEQQFVVDANMDLHEITTPVPLL